MNETATAVSDLPATDLGREPRQTLPPAAALEETGQAFGMAVRCLAAGDLEGGFDHIGQVVHQAPAHPEVLSAYAAVAFQLGDFAEARARFEEAAARQPTAPVYVELAETCLELKDIPAFEVALAKALELDKDCPEALLLLGNLNALSGHYQTAANAYRRALRRSPAGLTLHLLLAAVHYLSGDHAEAANVYRRSLSLDPENAVAKRYLAALTEPGRKLPTTTFKDMREEAVSARWRKSPPPDRARLIQPAPAPDPGPFDDTRRELRQAFGRQNGSSYLAPTDLSGAEVTPKRWLVVGSCVAVDWLRYFKAKCPGDYVLTNHLARLPDEPPQPVSEYDFQIVQVAARTVVRDAELWKLPYHDQAGHAALFETARNRLKQQLAAQMAWNQKYGLLTFVANFMVPQQNPLGRLLPRYDYRNPVYFFEKLNEALHAQVAAFKNAYVLDLDQIAAAFGRKYIQDDSVLWLNHGGYLPAAGQEGQNRIQRSPGIEEYYANNTGLAAEAVWAEVTAMHRTVRQANSIKLVVTDLDDTLWDGLITEQADIGPHLLESHRAVWPRGMLDALGFLKKRGILLAIISKNDEQRIREVWPKIFGNSLHLEDFAALRINWKPKAENMQEILAATNLTPRNVLFIDDNPVERAAMVAAFPELRVLSGLHLYWRRELLWSAETQPVTITQESARRTEMIHAQIARESERQTLSREEFLNSLDLCIKSSVIRSVDEPRFARTFELINKTNQFNTTGKRWQYEECREAFKRGIVFHVFSATDRFCDYGLVGVAIREGATLEQFVMSCRVVGLEVEAAVMAVIARAAREEGHPAVSASLVKTDANFLSQDLFRRCGFQEHDNVWTLTKLETVAAPDHIELTEGTEPLNLGAPREFSPATAGLPPDRAETAVANDTFP